MEKKTDNNAGLSLEDFRATVLQDYRLAVLSRQLSILGRREVLNGRAKFGIFGDGKEIAQLALVHQFRDGDWRSGYYRDQTWMLAAGIITPEDFFHQLYGNTDPGLQTGNGGVSFNNHFSTPNIDPDGSWRDLTKQKNSSADISPTAGQMPRLLGLAYASKLFREIKEWHHYTTLSRQGDEVAFGTIGDASTSEGHFWETLNAAGVLQVPMALTVFDDGYGISVPKKLQTTKGSISALLKGFEKTDEQEGIVLLRGKGWDYPGLCRMYEEGIKLCREEHVPVLFHIEEMIQPLGHSTSGSHERYKSKERLQWEEAHDPVRKMKEWMISAGLATGEVLDHLEEEAVKEASAARKNAWKAFQEPILALRDSLIEIIDNRSCMCQHDHVDKVGIITGALKKIASPVRKDVFSAARQILRWVCPDCPMREQLQRDLTAWLEEHTEEARQRYNAHLYNETPTSVLKVEAVAPRFDDDVEEVPGRVILRDNFDRLLAQHPLLTIFGEDVGYIGGVNQALEGLQQKYGTWRVADTGIREATIVGQGIGMALRGLRPIAEIQYFDYLLYALQTISDDLATTAYRTRGRMIAPLIIRTRGHRLEGIWHSGSPLSMVINSIRGVYVCVPRDMTRAAGFYNTLLAGQDPALVIEPLNGYRIREKMPANIGEYRIPLGRPEVLREGSDITVVTYGSCVRIAQEAAGRLHDFGISVELIDVQTLIPFDLTGTILESLKKTSRVLFFDEDVPGGATAYMMQKVLEEQEAWQWLDSEPRTLTAQEHRPAYGTDGDYFSNPSAEDLFDTVYEMMHEVNPQKYPGLF